MKIKTLTHCSITRKTNRASTTKRELWMQLKKSISKCKKERNRFQRKEKEKDLVKLPEESNNREEENDCFSLY